MLRSLFQSKVNAAKSKAIGNVQKAVSKKYLWYVIIFSSVLTLSFGISFLYPEDNVFYYICIQIYMLISGIVHVILMGTKFGWKNSYSFWEKLELTLLILLLTYILSSAVIYFSPLKNFFLLFPSAVIIFSFPMLFQSIFDYAMAIPEAEYKKWFYPQKVEMPDLDKVDFTNSYVLTLEIRKKDNERSPTIMKFKAPLNNITFGDMFFMYLYEYNEAHREGQIEYMDEALKSYGWLFYIKPNHWWNAKRVIDPSLTIRENKIKENGIIIPHRM
ncbi:MAG: TssN family type VI secretion system protein [Bacteroidota bacterium]